LRWLRLAASNGESDAQQNLGGLYEEGKGVVQDYSEALRFYRLAADAGNARAQYSLGTMYLSGSGVPKNDIEAEKWIRLAADQGWGIAQLRLGMMYLDKGAGPQNDISAHMWMNLAAARGISEAAGLRDELAKVMKPEHIADAQRLAREWNPKRERSWRWRFSMNDDEKTANGISCSTRKLVTFR
jgi:uncharacterized protein